MDYLRNYITQLKEQYITDTENQVESSKKASWIISVVSVAAIIIVGVILAPLISKISQRQYKAVEFYCELKPEDVHELV